MCYNISCDLYKSNNGIIKASQGLQLLYGSHLAKFVLRGFFIRDIMPKRLTSTEFKKRNEQFQLGLLWCSRCSRFLSIDNFYKLNNKSSNFGYRFYCKHCDKYHRLDKIREYTNNKNKELKRKFVMLAGGCCQKCGYREYNAALDFHHVYRASKECNPIAAINSNNFERAWRELDKCCLLCRNCHAAYGANEWKAEFVKRDGLGWTVGRELPIDDDRYTTKFVSDEFSPIPNELLTLDCEQIRLYGIVD